MKHTFILLLATILLTSCNAKNPKIISAEFLPISGGTDTEIEKLIEPYAQAQAVEMSVVIGYAAENIERGLPEGGMNTLLADAMLEYANTLKPTDMAISNYGGIRNSFQKGDITVGDVMQVMPFDNAVVLIELRGESLLRLADAIAAKGGEVQSGMSMKIRDGKAYDVLLNGKPIDPEKNYRIATSDYLSYGNDDLEPLAEHTKIEATNEQQRTVLHSKIVRETAAGRPIRSILKNQIYVEK